MANLSLTPSQIAKFNSDLRNELQLALQAARSQSDYRWFFEFAEEIRTDKKKTRLPFSTPSSIAKWGPIGQRIELGGVKYEDIPLDLEKVSDGLRLSIEEFEDPDTRAGLMGELASKANGLVETLAYRMTDALENGDTDPQWIVHDGQQFFSENHELFGHTFNNIVEGELSEDNPTAFDEAITRLMRIPAGADGRAIPIDGMKFFLFVPPNLRTPARALLENQFWAEKQRATENPYYNTAQPIVTSALQNPVNWYVVAVKENLKPFAHLKHRTQGDWKVIPKTNEDDPNVYDEDEYRWVMRAWQKVFPHAYFMVIKGIGGGS